MEPALRLWKKHYCDGQFDRCARFQLSLKGNTVPLTLLPNGKQLAPRSKEQINSAALFNAIEKGRLAMIRSMIKTGIAQMQAQTSDGLSPLMAAAKVGHADIVALMLEKGCNPWNRNRQGETALDIATKQGHAECVALLEQKMATTRAEDYETGDSAPEETPMTEEETRTSIVSFLKNLNPFKH
jgi:ankyrin repeat protein